eukprot:COSAG06_NODE_1061_length_10874_cov_7.752390_1_plen_245_part_00
MSSASGGDASTTSSSAAPGSASSSFLAQQGAGRGGAGAFGRGAGASKRNATSYIEEQKRRESTQQRAMKSMQESAHRLSVQADASACVVYVGPGGEVEHATIAGLVNPKPAARPLYAPADMAEEDEDDVARRQERETATLSAGNAKLAARLWSTPAMVLVRRAFRTLLALARACVSLSARIVPEQREIPAGDTPPANACSHCRNIRRRGLSDSSHRSRRVRCPSARGHSSHSFVCSHTHRCAPK